MKPMRFGYLRNQNGKKVKPVRIVKLWATTAMVALLNDPNSKAWYIDRADLFLTLDPIGLFAKEELDAQT